jgi:hypothetical protein
VQFAKRFEPLRKLVSISARHLFQATCQHVSFLISLVVECAFRSRSIPLRESL